jgi:cation transport protein ChaC
MALKREDILNGRIEERIKEAERMGLTTRLPPEQREATRRAILDELGDDEIWLFGYGSLMWNPCIEFVDRRPGMLYGYHRSFCLRTPTGRGSPEQPGLMLALKPGGSCQGIGYRIAREVAEHEFTVVWNREMVSGAYRPKVVNIQTTIGLRRAATFVINRQHPRYVASMPLQEAAAMIAVAEGWLGTCAEYLFSTVAHLDELGVEDGPMHELKRLVEKCRKPEL